MPAKKLLTALSYKWLPPLGDYVKLLVRFSITDGKEWPALGERAPAQQLMVTVKLSGTAQALWVERDPRLGERPNLERVLLHYTTDLIRQ